MEEKHKRPPFSKDGSYIIKSLEKQDFVLDLWSGRGDGPWMIEWKKKNRLSQKWIVAFRPYSNEFTLQNAQSKYFLNVAHGSIIKGQAGIWTDRYIDIHSIT